MRWFDLVVWAIVGGGFFTVLLARPKRSNSKLESGAALGTVGALCMIASFLVTHETVASGIVFGAMVIFVASAVFNIAAARGSRSEVD